LTLAQALLRALCFAVIPALLAGLTIRYLVPDPANSDGWLNVVAVAFNRFPIPSALGLFLLFATLVRYWLPRAPGGRYATALPVRIAACVAGRDLRAYVEAAAILRLLDKGAVRRNLAKTLPPEQNLALGQQLAELAGALVSDDVERVTRLASALRATATTRLAARQRRDTVVLVFGLTMAGGAALVLRTVFVETYQVLSGSMLPSLRAGDRIVVSKLAYRSAFAARDVLTTTPRRGDLVVFRNTVTDGPEHLVKRVIALPGDTVTMRGDRPVINGWKVPGCDAGLYVYPVVDGAVRGRLRVEFLGAHAYATIESIGTPLPEPYVVKDGELFVLGDNRTSSNDSRSWNDGQGAGVPFGTVEGRAERFFLATRRDGRVDFADFMGPLDRRLTAEGIDARSLEQGIARCLSEWPSETEPPPKAVASNGAGDGR
jgi:signal peptidase I